VGGSKAGGLPTLLFPLFLPSPFPSPLSFQTNQWEGRSDPVRGKFPGFPPTNTTPLVVVVVAVVVTVVIGADRVLMLGDTNSLACLRSAISSSRRRSSSSIR